MPYKPKQIEKLYYAIGEVADMFDVAPSLLRFWEGEFEQIKPKKNRKGERQYNAEDIENIRIIYHLVKEKGFTLQGAKDIIKTNKKKVSDDIEMIESLKKIRYFLVDLKNQLPSE